MLYHESDQPITTDTEFEGTISVAYDISEFQPEGTQENDIAHLATRGEIVIQEEDPVPLEVPTLVGEIPVAYMERHHLHDKKVSDRYTEAKVGIDSLENDVKKMYDDDMSLAEARIADVERISAANIVRIQEAEQVAMRSVAWQVRRAMEAEIEAKNIALVAIEDQKEDDEKLFGINRKALRHLDDIVMAGRRVQARYEKNRDNAIELINYLEERRKELIAAINTIEASMRDQDAILSECDELEAKLFRDERTLTIVDSKERKLVTEDRVNDMRNEWGMPEGEESEALLAQIEIVRNNAKSLKLTQISSEMDDWRNRNEANKAAKLQAKEMLGALKLSLAMSKTELSEIPTRKASAQATLIEEIDAHAQELHDNSKKLSEIVARLKDLLGGDISDQLQKEIMGEIVETPGDLRDVNRAVIAIISRRRQIESGENNIPVITESTPVFYADILNPLKFEDQPESSQGDDQALLRTIVRTERIQPEGVSIAGIIGRKILAPE